MRSILYYYLLYSFPYSLKYMEREWKAYVDEYTSSEILLSNCIAGAAFLTYCGAMGVDRRLELKSVLLCSYLTFNVESISLCMYHNCFIKGMILKNEDPSLGKSNTELVRKVWKRNRKISKWCTSILVR